MDIYNTMALIMVVQGMDRVQSFILDRYYPEIQTEESEEIHFDVDESRPILAPFVSPLVAGKIIKDEGFTTKTFKPAYVKPKSILRPGEALKRMAGEKIGGSMSASQRKNALLVKKLASHIKMITRRKEVMGIEGLKTGKVTVEGEGYPTVVVDFGRHADLTVDISGGDAEWGDEGVSILNNLQDWANLVLKHCGFRPVDVIMDVETWKIFRADPEVKERLDLRRVTQQAMSLDAAVVEGGAYMGTIDGFNIWTYGGWYQNSSGVLTPYLPDYTVIMASAAVLGAQAHGAILDEEVEGVSNTWALEYFPKSWLEKDPGLRYLMTQSAPLVIPYRPNASLCATVKAAAE